MKNGRHNNVHVGYEFGLSDVEHVKELLDALVNKYKEIFALKSEPNKKMYDLIRQLREAETPAPDQIAKEVLAQILTPTQPEKGTRNERIKAGAERKSKKRAMNIIRKNSAKKGD